MIRKILKEDSYSLATLHKEVWQETYRAIMSDEFLDNISAKKWSEGLKKIPELASVDAFVIEVEGELVGDIIFGKNRNADFAYEYEIYAINISPKYQKKGFGKMLLSKALENLEFCDKIYLKVACENENARAFYEKYGFKNTNIVVTTQFTDFVLREYIYEYVF